jgi:hypothetical protein
MMAGQARGQRSPHVKVVGLLLVLGDDVSVYLVSRIYLEA